METEKIIVIGEDHSRALEKQLRTAGYDVISAVDRKAALAFTRHETIHRALVVSQGSLVNVTETVVCLKDLCPTMKIVILLHRATKPTNRFLRQMLDHPIEGSEIMTRRELRQHLRGRTAAIGSHPTLHRFD
jgi:DNA-binding response OmpR family regulator